MEKQNESVEHTIEEQTGGAHYKELAIEPIEYICANKLDFIEGNIVKYISRHKNKNKDEDIKKIIDYSVLCLMNTYGYTKKQVAEYIKKFQK